MSVTSTVSRIFSAGGMLALPGCAALVLMTMEPEQRAALFLAPADKAVIYFYQDRAGEAAAAPAVYLDGEPIGEPTAAGFWYREVNPGVHSVALADDPAQAISLATEAGHLYFVGEEVDCAARSTPNLHAVNEAAGRKRVRALVAASKAPPSEVGPATLVCGQPVKESAL